MSLSIRSIKKIMEENGYFRGWVEWLHPDGENLTYEEIKELETEAQLRDLIKRRLNLTKKGLCH